MATTVKTAKLRDLPVSWPIRIVRGDTFNGPLFKHTEPDGTPIDTTAWAKVGKIYKKRACGAAEVQVLTIVDLPGPDFGYQPTLTPAQTVALACDNNWYEIETDDGGTVRTYFGGPAEITGVGDA